MNTSAFEIALQRQAIFELAIGIIILIGLFWATYWVIKAGVRDGIREATPWHRGAARSAMPPTPPGYRWTLTKDDTEERELRAD